LRRSGSIPIGAFLIEVVLRFAEAENDVPHNLPPLPVM
jgi:hypothetical protein